MRITLYLNLESHHIHLQVSEEDPNEKGLQKVEDLYSIMKLNHF